MSELLVFSVLLGDRLVACLAGSEYAHHIVCGGVSVNAYSVESYLDYIIKGMLYHFRSYIHICGKEGKSSSHIRVYHSAALEHTAHSAGLSTNIELCGDFLFLCVCSHYSFKGTLVAVIGKSLCKTVHSLFDRLYREYLSDNACGSYDYVIFVNTEALCGELTHFCCLLNTVRIAGICVYGVYDNRSCLSVSEVLLCNEYGSSLDFICGIYCSHATLLVGDNKCQIIFLLCCGDNVLLCCIAERLVCKSALYSVSPESLCGTYTAFYECYSFKFNKLHLFPP